MNRMKVFPLILVLIMLCACVKNTEKAIVESRETAVYTEDTTLGEGVKCLKVNVVTPDSSVCFTINTDAKTVGEALSEHNLIAGEAGQFGLYIKVVNGMRADFDKDGAYWGFYKDGEYMTSGVDTTEFADGDTYELKYTKG